MSAVIIVIAIIIGVVATLIEEQIALDVLENWKATRG
jgi:hypothetical protein